MDCRFKSFAFIPDIEIRQKKLELAKSYLISTQTSLSSNSNSPTAITQQSPAVSMPSAQVNQSNGTPINNLPDNSNKKEKDRPQHI